MLISKFSYAVGATERLVLFPTWLLHDLLGVVMLSTFGYKHFPPIEGYPQLNREESTKQIIDCGGSFMVVIPVIHIFLML